MFISRLLAVSKKLKSARGKNENSVYESYEKDSVSCEYYINSKRWD